MKPCQLLLGRASPIEGRCDGHTNIFGGVCAFLLTLKALTTEVKVSFSMATLTSCDFQHDTLPWVEAHLPLDSQSSSAVRSSFSLVESLSFLMW